MEVLHISEVLGSKVNRKSAMLGLICQFKWIIIKQRDAFRLDKNVFGDSLNCLMLGPMISQSWNSVINKMSVNILHCFCTQVCVKFEESYIRT